MRNQRFRDDKTELPRLALALTTLALVGFSLVLVCQMAWLSLAQRTDFAERNTLGERGRLILLLSLGAGLGLPAALGMILIVRRRVAAATGVLDRLAKLLAPLGALFVVPGLFLSQVARDKPLYYLIVLSAFGLIFNALLVRTLTLGVSTGGAAFSRRQRQLTQAWLRVPRWVPLLLLLLLASSCAYLLAHYGVAHHRLIQDTSEFLGVPDNVLANLRAGHHFRAPVLFGANKPGNYLTLHAEYGSLLFAPLYGLRPGVETLLWFQAAIAALAVIPLYLLASHKLGRAAAIWVGVAYLLNAPLHGSLVNGFSWLHAVTLFSFTLYYAVESERRWLFAVSLLLLLSISEFGPLNVLGYGLMLLATRRRARLGVALSLLALPLLAFNFWLSMRGAASGETPALLATLRALVENPVYFVWDLARFSKLTPILHALAPLCLLPVFEFACWPLLFPGVLITSASTLFWPNHPGGFADAMVWVPGCFLALLVALERRAQSSSRAPLIAAVLALSVTVLSHSYNYGALLREDAFGGIAPEAVRPTRSAQARYDALLKALQPIPLGASVAATTYLVSFVSNRPDACDLFRDCGRPDYLLLSSRETGAVRQQLSALFATHQYRLLVSTFNEFYLFQRASETTETRAAIRSLGFASP